MVHISIFRKSNFLGDFIGLNILFWPLYADDPWSRGNLACVFVWQPCLHWKSVQIGVILYTFIALSKQESAPLKKTISDHGDRSKGRFSGATLHVRYPTFGTNGLNLKKWVIGSKKFLFVVSFDSLKTVYPFLCPRTNRSHRSFLKSDQERFALF